MNWTAVKFLDPGVKQEILGTLNIKARVDSAGIRDTCPRNRKRTSDI